MASTAVGHVDHWYLFGRRQWADGMTLESCATLVVTHHADGGMALDMTDDDGNSATFVLDVVSAASLRAMQESIFTGVGVMEIPVPA